MLKKFVIFAKSLIASLFLFLTFCTPGSFFVSFIEDVNIQNFSNRFSKQKIFYTDCHFLFLFFRTKRLKILSIFEKVSSTLHFFSEFKQQPLEKCFTRLSKALLIKKFQNFLHKSSKISTLAFNSILTSLIYSSKIR